MINHVKSIRLSICRGLAAFALGCLALNAGAAEIPFEGQRNTIEYKQAGNTYTWSPVTGETPKSGIPYRPDLAKGAVSDTEPKVKWTPRLPYEHKGGDAARVNVRATVDPAKVAQRAKDAVKGAAAGAATSGNPYVTVAALACGVFCDALIDWGIDKLNISDEGEISVSVPDSSVDYPVSDGYQWCYSNFNDFTGCNKSHSVVVNTFSEALEGLYQRCLSGGFYNCTKFPDSVKARFYSNGSGFDTLRSPSKKGPSSCPAGHYFDPAGNCVSSLPSAQESLGDYYTGKYTGEGWSHWWAKMTAEAVKNGANVFTDGTSVSITGPSIVPLSTTQSTSPVNLVPGTNTPAPVGHTGLTDSGTKTETTTTQAKNTYSGNQQTVSTQTTTTTNITNNITNNTTTNITNQTETDLPPEKESEDFCEKNPDSLACAEADTPEAEIPEGQINISYEYADIFGNGACPADVYLTTHGQSLKVWDWQSTCSNVQTYFRPVLIACCAFIAFVIVSAGAKE